MKDSGFNAFALHALQRLKVTLVPTDANDLKTLLENLKQGGFTVILPDHVPQPSGGVIVPFLESHV